MEMLHAEHHGLLVVGTEIVVLVVHCETWRDVKMDDLETYSVGDSAGFGIEVVLGPDDAVEAAICDKAFVIGV